MFKIIVGGLRWRVLVYIYTVNYQEYLSIFVKLDIYKKNKTSE